MPITPLTRHPTVMRLYVYVLEAKGLPRRGGGSDTYVKMRMGKHKSRTRTVRNGVADPAWNEEFVFRMEEEEEKEASNEGGGRGELELQVFREEDGGGRGEFLGGVRVHVWRLLDEGTPALPPTWFSLRSKSMANDECGEILLTVSVYGSSGSKVIRTSPRTNLSDSRSRRGPAEDSGETDPPTAVRVDKPISVSEQVQSAQSFAGRLVHKLLNKNEETLTASTRKNESSELSDDTLCNSERKRDESSCGLTFEEAMDALQSRDETEILENLPGGILLEQTYSIEPKYLNAFLFEPDSRFRREMAEFEGTTNYHEEPWMWKCEDKTCLRRLVTYTKAATKVIKAVKATEEQIYLAADGKNFAILIHVSTPDVPYGNCFELDLLYRIMPGLLLPSGEESSHLVISWNISFFQNTVMKGMIEGGVRQGLKESYEKFADLLAQNIKPVELAEHLVEKERLLASLQQDHRSDWELAVAFFCNFTVLFTIFMALYIVLHILLSRPGPIQGLEFPGLDLPDTFGELITGGILVLQGQLVFNMISHFIQARIRRGSDHGIKAQGDGWLLTVALIKGSDLPSATQNGCSDPYVVFSCSGKTRTSSVQLHTSNPQWNEILEFDAMLEPPAVLDVEVFDFDGPFDLAVPLGHAEINFLKHTSEELADMCIDLEGKLAQASQSQLHLRIFLENTRGVETIKEYLTKMEKEVGKKLNLRSPHRNSAFQKLFGLPPEEFLIKDFSCYLKRRIPLQGKLFLSARTVGFYANLFGHKTKFFFLWEDIEDIQIVSPSWATVGSPALLIILRKGRGLDARHGAKSRDEEGRLKFQFQSFPSFNMANKTIFALWKTRSLTPEEEEEEEEEAKMAEDLQDQGGKSVEIEDAESSLSTEDKCLSKSLSVELPLNMMLLMEVFDGGSLEKKIMGKVGCLNYSVTEWETMGSNVYERKIEYKFNRHMSIFGGEVNSTQQKTPTGDANGWLIEEDMTLHNVPFADHFGIHLMYKIGNLAFDTTRCVCEVSVGVVWMKSMKFQKRITRNICDKMIHRSKEIFELTEKEFISAKTWEQNT